jgi:hypothetical protein
MSPAVASSRSSWQALYEAVNIVLRSIYPTPNRLHAQSEQDLPLSPSVGASQGSVTNLFGGVNRNSFHESAGARSVRDTSPPRGFTLHGIA